MKLNLPLFLKKEDLTKPNINNTNNKEKLDNVTNNNSSTSVNSLITEPTLPQKKNFKIKRLLLPLIILILVVVSYFLYTDFYGTPEVFNVNLNITNIKENKDISEKRDTEVPIDISKYEKGVFVGNVKVYYADLEKKYSLFYANTKEARSSIANWKRVLNMVAEDAILQNEGHKAGLYSNSDSTKLDPRKVNMARNYFNTKGKEFISGEFISLWFYNTNPPTIGVEQAKEKTNTIINDLREKIAKNEITLEEAGKSISQNIDLASIDSAYQSNAYRKFTYISKTNPIFNDPYINENLWDLNEGELSKVLVGHDFNSNSNYEAYFIVIKVTEKRSDNVKASSISSAEQLVRKRILEGYNLEL